MNKTKLNLTNDEWLSLLDGEADDSQLPTCCANISSLRDTFVSILRQGRNEGVYDHDIRRLKIRLKWVADGHDLTPVLKKVCEQIGFDPSSAEHEIGMVES